jgi:hypothetical protein
MAEAIRAMGPTQALAGSRASAQAAAPDGKGALRTICRPWLSDMKTECC